MYDLLALPIGVDDFKEIVEKEYYYVDKILFIKELLDLKGKINVFMRPRRFEKSLNLSMLKYFFEKTEEDKPKMISILNNSYSDASFEETSRSGRFLRTEDHE